MNQNVVICPKCLLPFQFFDIERSWNQTIGIYKCPLCGGNYRV